MRASSFLTGLYYSGRRELLLGYVYYMGTDGGLARVAQDGSAGGGRIGNNFTNMRPAFANGRVYWQGTNNDLCWALGDGSAQGTVGGNLCGDTPFPLNDTVYFQGLDTGLDSCALEGS